MKSQTVSKMEISPFIFLVHQMFRFLLRYQFRYHHRNFDMMPLPGNKRSTELFSPYIPQLLFFSLS